MTVAIDKTVRELALENPSSTRVFEKLGIDYCCGGNISLEHACQAANVGIDQVLDSLEKAQTAPAMQKDRDWQIELLAALIAHIQSTHHKYTRGEIARLMPLFEKVCSVHGNRHSELLMAKSEFRVLAQELSLHMMKEEMVLFPYIVRMEEAAIASEPVLPAPFGTVQNPIAAMAREHDSAGDLLRSLRTLTNGYTPPANACVSYKTLYAALGEFEQDLHQHIHLENNLLFPRAVEMEARH